MSASWRECKLSCSAMHSIAMLLLCLAVSQFVSCSQYSLLQGVQCSVYTQGRNSAKACLRFFQWGAKMKNSREKLVLLQRDREAKSSRWQRDPIQQLTLLFLHFCSVNWAQIYFFDIWVSSHWGFCLGLQGMDLAFIFFLHSPCYCSAMDGFSCLQLLRENIYITG